MIETKIIITGGTFEKDYNQQAGELGFDYNTKQTATEALLATARATGAHAKVLYLVDSLEMTDEQRTGIAGACSNADELHLVVVHGTDTMVESAQVAKKQLEHSNKTVVFTGAMRPHALGNSDASFNLGFALASAQHQTPGVYVAMNGQVFDPDNVKKNRQTLEFEEL